MYKNRRWWKAAGFAATAAAAATPTAATARISLDGILGQKPLDIEWFSRTWELLLWRLVGIFCILVVLASEHADQVNMQIPLLPAPAIEHHHDLYCNVR